MKKKLLKPLLVSVLGLSTLSATISCSCGRKEDVKPADNKKDVVTPIDTPIEREYDSVKLPELPEAEKRFKSIRMSLKDLTFTVSNVPAKYNQYSNKVEKATVVYEAKLSDAKNTIKELEFDSSFYATYKTDSQKLELKGNVTLPQEATVDGEKVKVVEYKVKQVKLEGATYNLDQPIVGNPNNTVVDILDIHSKDNKLYIEFSEDISNHLFHISAVKNGNSNEQINDNKIDFKVMKREGAQTNTILEVSLKGTLDEDLYFAELSKIMLKKEGHYHLFVFHSPWIENDKEKFRIQVKDKPREYRSVALPQMPEESQRFQSIRMTLKDLSFTVSNTPEKYNQYSNKVENATVVYEAKLSDAENTVKVLEFNSQFYATYKADTQKLELKGNVSLPQQATVNGKEVNIAEYTIKQVKLENQTYNLDHPITGNPNESVVNILDVYAKDKKVYIEFNGDISEYKFYLRANKNGNSSSELKEEALDWEVVKREGSEEKNVLEVRLNEEHADGALYAQLNKIILKKDDYYHLYLFHAPYANNDSSKIQIKVKDDLKLVKLPEAREESKRTKSAKQIVTNYTGEAPKGTYKSSSTTVEPKYAKMVLGIGDPNEPSSVKYSTSERRDIINVLAKTDKIAVEGAHPVPATYEENGRTVEVEKFFVKSVIIDEKEYVFDAPVVKNAKEFNRKSPSIIDTYVIDNKLYVEFDKNIKSKMFNISFLKDGNPFGWTNDEDVEFQVVTKEGSDIENTILQIWPTSKLSSSDTRVIKLLRIVTLEGTLINTYTFNRLGNDSKDIEIKLKDN